MPSFVYRGESPRLYPYPPIARELTPGDLVDLEPDEVPTDGRFFPAPDAVDSPAPAKAVKAAAKAQKETL